MPELNNDLIGEGAQRLYVLHGIFGAGRNWASIARKLIRQRSDWSARLIDLREHGGSQGFNGPHTVHAAAQDIAQLAESLGEQPTAILGHSFGGKVALMYAREHPGALRQVWVIDSTPETRAPSGSAWDMLEIIRSAPESYSNREELVAHLATHGIPTPTAQWMATNLEYRDGTYRWRFELSSIEDLLNDFFVQDMWSVLDSDSVEIHLVKATESSVLSPAGVERVRSTRAHLHEVKGGHWLNADNPDAVTDLLSNHLPKE